LPQPGVTDTEVMGYFMADRPLDLISDVLLITAGAFDLDIVFKDCDLVRWDHSVAGTASG
jgi:hypothetical protein